MALLEHVFLNNWVTVVIAAVVIYRLWYKMTTGVCTSTRRLDGRTALVTGANTGIGLETAKDFARRGARVLLACRDVQRGRRALESVQAEASKGASVALYQLDLGSLASVRSCAAQIRAQEPRLDILVNNAGVGGVRGKTADGLHRGLQVNHFGPFLFTLLLLDLVRKSAPSRIIFVSSIAHEYGKFAVEELEKATFNETKAYAISKLGNILVSNELARHLRGSGVTVNSLHPGAVQTDIFRHIPYGFDAVVKFLFGFLCKSAKEGAQTTIYLAVSDEVEGVSGRYFSDCKEKRAGKAALDQQLARAVWEKSEALVGLKDSERPSFDS